MENKIKEVELFAGVGDFRLELEGWKGNQHLEEINKYYEVRMNLLVAIYINKNKNFK